jgi:hypothetical protein
MNRIQVHPAVTAATLLLLALALAAVLFPAGPAFLEFLP